MGAIVLDYVDYLTLTRVVFESRELLQIMRVYLNLTLTRIVFELQAMEDSKYTSKHLTLTRVVFE